jgi:hypothetical protein
VVYPGDKLAFLTKDGARQIVLSVNEMNEQDSVSGACGTSRADADPLSHHPQTGHGVRAEPRHGWQPNFTYDPAPG